MSSISCARLRSLKPSISLARARPRGLAGASCVFGAGVGIESLPGFAATLTSADSGCVRPTVDGAGVCCFEITSEPPPTSVTTRPAATSEVTSLVCAGYSTPGTIMRYGGIWRTTRSTSIVGAKTAALFTVRMTSRISRQLSQLATCASTWRRALSSRDPCTRSGSISWISVSIHLFIFQKLLYRPDRVVIVNPCRSLGTTNDFRNLLVRQSLLNPQREHFPLRRRQCIERFSDTLLRFYRDQTVERSVFTDM